VKETKFGIKVAYGMRMMPELRIHAYCRERAILHSMVKNNRNIIDWS